MLAEKTEEVVIVKDKEERRLSKIKIGIMRNPKFALWSGLMTVGKTSITDSAFVPTACTNGRDEFYGRKFVQSLDDKEFTFVVLHETLHKAYRHLTTWRRLAEQDMQLCNMACDYVINLQLADLDKQENLMSVPTKDGKPIALIDEKYRGMNTKQVFDLLKQDKKDGKGAFANGNMDGDSLDDHDWKGSRELTEEEKKSLAKEIDQAIRQGIIAHNKTAGTGRGGLDRALEEMVEPEVDWREVLREFVKATCSAKDASSWRKPNRRFLSTGLYMPSMVGESVGHLVIGIDTSGSIQGRELSEFLSEVQAIATEVHPEKVDLFYWDCEVAGHEEYDANTLTNIVSSTQPKGGGGTDPTCMIEYMKEKGIKPQAVIILTDGYIGNWGTDWNAPVLWTVVRNKGATAPIGKTIHVRED
jgi:predicted metal-dependent peptidase